MNNVRHTILALAIVLLAATSAFGQGSAVSLEELWGQATRSAREGNLENASDTLQSLVDAGSAYGVKSFRTFADSAALMARNANLEGNQELRQWAMTAATRLDPDSPTVAFVNVEIARSNGNWGAVPSSLFKGIAGVFTNYTNSLKARSDLLLSIIMAVSLAAAAFALVLLLRYGRCAAHDFREVVGIRFRAGTATVVAFALLFLPVFLWLNPLWLVFYWLMLFFAYANHPEKVLITILLVLVAVAPVAVDWTAFRIAGLESPIVAGADDALNGIYEPTSAQRIREILNATPDNAQLHFLLGNLVLQRGNEREALLHLERAAEIDSSVPGIHLNIGNLHFLNQDYPAAIVSYERAAQLDPEMAIARYNHSVAAGEQYDFDTQGAMLEEAKSIDRSRIQKLLANPPAMKVVNYQIPLTEAWRLAREVSANQDAREVFGQYASFDPVRSIMNPPSIGAILALVVGVYLWLRRRKTGVAGSCVKCGRTFCHRCKSSRESATYCTQCIHIYLKRDGVSLDTKKRKLDEVQSYQRSTLRTRKVFATFLPGSASMLDGAPLRGGVVLFFFLLFVAVATMTGRLAPIAAPGETIQIVLRAGSILLAVVVWVFTAIPTYKESVVG